ncbi:SDR family NAD(P)-dependent oxidoreductase [Paenibacillus sp. BR2-3]|uniref:SDR family NAD(P)-dependent oxidoreductase n=1 Tax=Paenibacillus sp. BR2-3 TaxID=3048494 RepID=UPI0039774A6B
MRSIIERVANGQISKEEGLWQIAQLKQSDKQELVYFTRELSERELAPGKDVRLGNLLVFAADKSLEMLLRNSFTSLFDSLVFVTAGESFGKVEELRYQLRMDQQEDYVSLLSSLEQRGLFPNSILHLISEESVHSDRLDTAMKSSIYSIFSMTKALLSFKKRTKINILFQYKESENYSIHAAMDGFIKSVMIENPNLLFKTVSTDDDRKMFNSQMVEHLLLELGKIQNESRQIHYRGSRRFVPVLEQHVAADHQEHNPSLGVHPVYIITGGMGAIGYTLARHLADRCQASLILTGRTPLNPAMEEKVKALQTAGNEVVYVCADITSLSDTQALLTEAKARFPKVHGILHCAGSTNDSFILHKEKGNLDNVLAPKVAGTSHLFEVFKNEELDFMMLFSSISAVIGNVGQCDYAYANSFMDHFAAEKRESVAFKLLSVNWPLWKDGGMATTDESMEFLRKNLGIAALPAVDGIKAFSYISRNLSTNAAVLYGDSALIKQAIHGMNYPETVNESRNSKVLKPEVPQMDKEGLKQGTEQYLKNIFIKVTKIPPHALGLNDSFEKIGFDSIMAMSINEELEASFGELSKTLLFEYQTLRELSEYFLEHHAEAMARIVEPPAQKKTSAPAARADVQPPVPGKPPLQPKRIQPGAAGGPKDRRDRKPSGQDIAIVGVSGKFPMSPDLQAFWNNLIQAQDCITEIPADRWSIEEYYTTDKNQLGKMYCKWGGFIDDVDRFDALFFNISPREAEIMDPQERLFLECAYSAIEDAGYTRDTLGSQKVGVFAGVMYGQYQLLDAEIDGNKIALSSVYASIANRVSYHLNLNGPSIALDTMCSSSLTSIHLACDSIRKGESDFAIAGGVNVSIHPDKYIFLSQQKFAASDGRCRSFGEGGDGYVPGEGVGAVLLKSLEQAIADGDHIYAVIKGSSINHGGKTTGYTVPNPTMQGAVIQETLQAAGVHPRTINYLEAHGTGTSLGDPIEVSGLVKAFKENTNDKQFCAIGSVKSNIGHCESAAGIAAIIKVLLQMKHGLLVPSLHSEELNGHIRFEDTPFYVQRQVSAWDRVQLQEGNDRKEYPRRAGVSSFGAGGANAHIILEEYIQPAKVTDQDSGQDRIMVLSAKTEERLKTYAKKMGDYLDSIQDEALCLDDIAYTLQVGREPFAERLAIVAGSVRELKELLNEFNNGQVRSGKIFRGNTKGNKEYIELFNTGNAGLSFVEMLLDDGNTDKIAQLWTMGLELDWHKLYESNHHKRLSLPTYPFARNRYWVNEVKRREIAFPAQISNVTEPGQLVERNLSTIDGYRFSSRNALISQYYHSLKWLGQEYMNSFGVLAFAREAVELVGYKKDIVLENLVWSGMINQQQPHPSLDVHIFPDGRTSLCEVLTGDQQVIFQCGIAHGESETGQVSYAKTPFQKGGQDEGILKQVQQSLRSLYGFESSLEQVTGLQKDKDTLLAFVDSGESSCDSLSAKVLNLACQVLLAATVQDGSERPMALHSIEKMSYRHKELQEFIIRVERTAHDQYTLAVVAEDGENVLLIQGVAFDDLQAQDQETAMYYTTEWVESPQKMEASLKGDIVLFLDHTEELPKFKESFGKDARLVCVTPAEQFDQAGDHLYTMRFDDKRHYLALLDSLKARGISVEQIVYFASPVEMPVQEKLNRSLYPMLFLTQALMESRTAGNIRLLYVSADKGNENSLLDASLGGFIKTLRLESPNYKFKTVSLTGSVPQAAVQGIMETELLLQNQEMEVLYSSAARYVKRIVQASNNKPATAPISLKENGVYIVTGGLGGLGSIFAGYLAETRQARLILTGRSPLDEGKKLKLAAIQKLGGMVEYVVSDASNAQDAQALVRHVKEKYGRIDGILHCAGIHQDAYILKKDKASFDQVISSKVVSTLHLDLAAKDEELDFIILFSSITGETGNPGQADYAYANSFMNEFARYRERLAAAGERSGRTLSIAWPLWEADGMQLSEEQRQILALQTGLIPLPVDKGIEAFEYLLVNGVNPLIVGYGQAQKVGRLLDGINRAEQETVATERAEAEGETDPDLLDQTIKYLTGLFSELLKLDAEEIDITADFEEYGIESVMVGYFNGKLEEELGEVSKTLLFEYQTIQSLAAHMVSRYAKPLMNRFGSSSETVRAQPAEQPEQVSGYAEKPFIWKVLKSFAGQAAGRPAMHQGGSDDDIAIIGLSGKYPQADDIYEFWNNIADGKDCIREIPADRWDYKKYFDSSFDKVKEGKMYSKWGGFLEDVDKFDPAFFNIAPREAVIMDPQERIFAETVWSALEDAGYTRKKLQRYQDGYGANVGVFAGATTYSYQLWGPEEWERGNLSSMPNVSPWSIANRISYMFNFSGPSLAIDTACSSSLAAVHAACESLKNQDCKLAIAGGVNLYLHPYKYVLMCQTKMLSPTGKCHSFGEEADGFVPGEGVGAVLLKPLKEAVKDGDHIYGVIKATEINHGGKVSGYTVPNPNAQVSLVSKALKKAGVDAGTITYMEAHGTGTRLGDPIEINALNQVFDEYNPDKQSCAIGSVKSNIGHLEAAAGIASITKVLMQLKHKQLAPSIHADQTNSNIDFDNSYFNVQRQAAPWKAADGATGTRRAGVSSFGAGGTNAFVLIEEYNGDVPAGKIKSDQVLVLSAKTPYSLKQMAVKLHAFLETHLDNDLSDIAYTLQLGREEMAHRLAFSCRSLEELKAKLKLYVSDESREDIFCGVVSKRTKHAGYLSDTSDTAGVAAQWVQGAEVDWEQLHQGENVRVIPLPTYAFERESYWITRTESRRNTNETGKIHPLIDRNLSSFNKQKYETVLSDTQVMQDRDYFSFIELFRIAAELSLEVPCHVIEDVVWGVRPELQAGRSLITTLYEDDQHIDCETGYENANGEYIACSQGKVAISACQQAELADPGSMVGLGANEIIRDDISFNCSQIERIQEMRVAEDRALMNVRLKSFADLSDSKVLFSYSAVEEIVQSLVQLTQHTQNYELCELRRCTVFSPLGGEVKVFAKWRTLNNQMLACQIYIMDQQQNMLVTMEELTLRLTGDATANVELQGIPASV